MNHLRRSCTGIPGGTRTEFSRRDFLYLISLGIGGLAARPLRNLGLPEFPESENLGRIAVGKVELKARPDPDSQTIGVLYEDAVVPWLREATGVRTAMIFNNQRWVETPQGYIYGPYVQPVKNQPNQPVAELPISSRGPGMWAEITVPFAESVLDKDEPSSNSWVKAKLEQGLPLRLYYSQVFWIDQIRQDSQGRSYYRVNPNYYGGVDMLWAAAEAFRPVTADELAPIHPEVTSKYIRVDARYQILSCFEGGDEVYFARISTGAKFNMYGEVVDKWITPPGNHRITRKYISLQMSGGTTGAGYDLPGIGWTSIFATGGVAVHSTFWHNNYGDPVSHGCVNAAPDDAKWVFLWTNPAVVLDPGFVDVTVTGEESTRIEVIDV